MEKVFFNMEENPLLKEKKEQRKVAGAVGLSLLALFLILTEWSVPVLRILKNLGLDDYAIYKILINPAVNEIIQIFVSTTMLIIPAFFLLRMTHTKAHDVVPLGKPKTKGMAAIIVAAVGFCMISSLLNNYAAIIFESFGYKFPTMSNSTPKGVLGFLLVFLSTAVFPALLEEFMMRGVLLGVLRKWGDGFAIIISALIFSLMHASLIQFLFTFLVGLLLGFVTVKTESLWPAIIIHGINNFLSVAFSYIGEIFGDNVRSFSYLAFLIAVFVVSIIATLIISKDFDVLKLKKADTLATESQKIGWFLSSFWVIAAIVAAFYIAIFMR